ncbi:TetR/AcrR family transcriptional regulator [Streptomyces sp. CA-100214]
MAESVRGESIATVTGRRRLPASERRAQILASARECFIEFGYHATTTLRIGERIGVSESLVLKYYRNKEELFRATVAAPLLDIVSDQAARNRPRLKGEIDTLSAFRSTEAFILTTARTMRADGKLFTVLLSSMHQFPDLVAELGQVLDEQMRELGSTVDAVGHKRGFREHDGRVSIYTSVGAALLASLFHEDLESFARALTELYFFGLLSDDEARRMLRAQLGLTTPRE